MLIFLLLLALAGAILMIRMGMKAQREPQFNSDGQAAPAPTRLEPRLPDERIDFTELRIGDAVAIETVSGSRYRFTLADPDDRRFDVVCKPLDQPAQSFQAVVTGSLRKDVVFKNTFAVGCQLHLYVVDGAGLIPKRTSVVLKADLREVGAADNEDLLN